MVCFIPSLQYTFPLLYKSKDFKIIILFPLSHPPCQLVLSVWYVWTGHWRWDSCPVVTSVSVRLALARSQNVQCVIHMWRWLSKCTFLIRLCDFVSYVNRSSRNGSLVTPACIRLAGRTVPYHAMLHMRMLDKMTDDNGW